MKDAGQCLYHLLGGCGTRKGAQRSKGGAPVSFATVMERSHHLCVHCRAGALIAIAFPPFLLKARANFVFGSRLDSFLEVLEALGGAHGRKSRVPAVVDSGNAPWRNFAPVTGHDWGKPDWAAGRKALPLGGSAAGPVVGSGKLEHLFKT
mmetsp:Transcript_15383/g.45571  ORF Transcript_15383/g.45571 Transcript_15383/m.45571 type:complete len:150 (-) Transcript_15383:945-1394(-)